MPGKSKTPSYLRRCVVDVVAQGKDTDAAFAICNATMQKAGYLTPGPGQKETKKGETRKRHFSGMKDNPEYTSAYEKVLKLARKERKIAKEESIDPRMLGQFDYHPFSEVLASHVAGLIESMMINGYAGRPIVTVGPKHLVVDGRHRVQAAKQAGVNVRVVNVQEEEYERLVNQFLSMEQIADTVLSMV